MRLLVACPVIIGHLLCYHGRRFRTLNVLDERVREVLDIVIDTSTPDARVVRTLDRRQVENAENPTSELCAR